MKNIFILAVFCLTYQFSSASGDTLVKYYDAHWGSCSKDSAKYYGKLYKDEAIWRDMRYLVDNNKLVEEASYSDTTKWTRVGKYKRFYENSSLSEEIDYNAGNIVSGNYFYENGTKRAEQHRNNNGELVETGWDESGNIIPGYIIEREAQFPGGSFGWKKYLERNLNSLVAGESGAPNGYHKVVLQFIVSKEGAISNIKVIQAPVKCHACVIEAVRVIEKGPNWEPAIQYNKPVLFYASQAITFVVSEE